MKLEMTLPERPGFLHVLPMLDLFLLLLLFFMLGPSLVLQSGVMVELPPSKFQMERFRNAMVVTLGPGHAAPRIHLGRQPVTLEELAARLDGLRAEGAAAKAIMLLQTDADTAVGMEREVAEMILSKGFRLAMVGQSPKKPLPPGSPDASQPEP
ncbi:MAG: biopolymer transporter ExbD [Verrucomicrobia bacterium]|nr:biopolymer transporter ExbD [Verrucomicrobiota bacterium]